ncbi:MAG: CCC motif membrane protein [Bacteroidota bacterium]
MNKEKLPHSQAALILGILSIFTACCCYGFIGIIFGIIGLIQAKKAIAVHDENPELYNGINNANTGKVTSIIGLVIGVIVIIFYIYLIQSGQYEIIMEQYQEIFEQYQ